jgi:hypothetical protein
LSTVRLNTASAVGERQMLPMQTNKTRIFGSFGMTME